MRVSFVTAFFLLTLSCKTPKDLQTYKVPEAPGSMSCIIHAEVLSPLNAATTDDSLCSIYPCKARVRIIDIVSCGSSVSLFFNAGDTLTVQFAYTLHNTKKLFPKMQEHYPGLKKGDIFFTAAEQRMKPGTGEYFLIYGYKRE